MPACPFITVPFGLCKQILIDLYRYFGSLTGSGSFHHRADGLGNPALFADDSAHIVGAHVQMVHNHTLFIGASAVTETASLSSTRPFAIVTNSSSITYHLSPIRARRQFSAGISRYR